MKYTSCVYMCTICRHYYKTVDVSATIYNVVKTYITRWSLLTCFDRQAVIIRYKVEIQNFVRNCAPTWDASGE